jgi:hypothetical protein
MDTPRSLARGLLARYRYPLLIALVLLCVGAVALNAATRQSGAGAAPASAPTITSSTTPGLTWNQPNLSPSVVAGAAATTTTITFTATGKLPNATVQLSPNLAGLVSVSPTNLGTVIQGQTVTLTLTASAPASSTPAVMQGSIQVQKQQNPPLEVYGSALPVALAINWPTYTSPGGFTVALPPTYSPDELSPQKTVLLPTQQTLPNDVAPIFINIETEQGATLYDHLHALGLSDQDITPVTIGNRSFLRYVEVLGDGGEYTTGYVAQFSSTTVIDIASLNSIAATGSTFQTVLNSIGF